MLKVRRIILLYFFTDFTRTLVGMAKGKDNQIPSAYQQQVKGHSLLISGTMWNHGLVDENSFVHVRIIAAMILTT
jgi:hypothetical protein